MWKKIGAACLAAMLCAVVATGARAQGQSPIGILTISVQPASFSESGGGQAATGTITRNTSDLTAPLTVTLASSDETEISLPETVVIPAGSSSTTFVVGAVDDVEVDFSRTINITVSAPGFASGLAVVTVEDDEAALTLGLTPSTVREDAGATAVTATLSRTQAASMGDLSITLTSSAPDLVKVPPGIVIPDGQTTVTFPVELIDNDELNNRVTVSITAIRSFATTGSVIAGLTVIDDESLLEVRVTPASFSEGAGATAATVNISRSQVAADEGPASLTIASNDTSEATVPSFVVLPKGVMNVTLPVAAVDDGVVDGPQKVTISATSDGLEPGSQEFTVTDNDTPRLSLTLNTTQTSESNGQLGAIGTITRNTPITQDLVVNLKSSNPNQASVPPTVRIPRGAVSADFPIRAVDDIVRDGLQRVTISASRSGFPTVTSPVLSVFDNEGQSLRVTLVSRETREKTGTVSGTVARSGPTTAELSVTLTLSNSAAATFGSDPTKPQFQITVVIPRGSSSAVFRLAALDNEIPDDVQNTTVLAAAPGFQNGAATLRVVDNDDPAILTLTIDRTSYVENAGPMAALATITRNTATTSEVVVFLESTDAGAARVPFDAVIPTGSTSATFFISAVDDDICLPDDNQEVRIRGTVAGFAIAERVILALNDDRCFGRGLTVTVTSRNTKALTTIIEDDGPSAGTILVQRSDDVIATYNLVVDLVSSDVGRAGAAPITEGRPTRVVIPAGRSSITVPLSALDNTLVEGCKSVTITPVPVGFTDPSVAPANQVLLPINQVGTRVGYLIETDSIDLQDDESAIENIVVRPSTFNESGSSGVATGTVTRAASLEGEIQVVITSTDPSEVSVSTNPDNPKASLTVRIPAGVRSASFAVVARDDDVVDGDQRAFLEARVNCYTPVTRAEVIVRDNELPTLSIKTATSVREGGSVVATLTRNTLSVDALTVSLQSTDASEVVVPRTVTIPAGKASVTFTLNGVQDNVLDFDQRVRVIASAPGFRATGGDIIVLDTAGLSLTVAPRTLSEGATARATVTRNTATTSAMTVSIASNNPSRVRVPLTVTIPAGATSVTFDVAAINDNLDNGNASVTLTASKTGLLAGSATVSVLDNDPLLVAAQSTSGAKLSSATAQNNAITLNFTAALDADSASDTAHFTIETGGESIAIDSATYNAAARTVVLHLASGALDVGDVVVVRWDNLVDANDMAVAGATTITVR